MTAASPKGPIADEGGNGLEVDPSLQCAADTRPREDETLRRPYRPLPRDFEALWPSVGWSGAELVWRAHARTIARWVDTCGRERMVLARKKYLEAQRAIAGRARRKRYSLAPH